MYPRITTRCWMNCDSCGDSFGEDCGFPATPAGKRALRKAALDNGMITMQGKNYCVFCLPLLSKDTSK